MHLPMKHDLQGFLYVNCLEFTLKFQYIINIITSLLYDQACYLNVACGFATIDKAVYSEKWFHAS